MKTLLFFLISLWVAFAIAFCAGGINYFLKDILIPFLFNNKNKNKPIKPPKPKDDPRQKIRFS